MVRTTVEKWQIIRKLAAENWTTRQIGDVVQLSSGTVSYWIRNETGPSQYVPTNPRRNASDIKVRRRLVQTLALRVRNGNAVFESAKAIRNEVVHRLHIKVSKRTINNDLHAMGFSNRSRPKVCATSNDCAARLRGARAMLTMKGGIVFTDEKLWTTNHDGWRRQWVKKGQRPCPRLKQRFPSGRCMVWGAIGIGFRCLVILPERTRHDGSPYRLTAAQYVRRCLSGVVVDHCLATKSRTRHCPLFASSNESESNCSSHGRREAPTSM